MNQRNINIHIHHHNIGADSSSHNVWHKCTIILLVAAADLGIHNLQYNPNALFYYRLSSIIFRILDDPVYTNTNIRSSNIQPKSVIFCKLLVSALVLSHLNYCNAIFFDLPSTVSRPKVCNWLPAKLRQATDLKLFEANLKTHFVNVAFNY